MGWIAHSHAGADIVMFIVKFVTPSFPEFATLNFVKIPSPCGVRKEARINSWFPDVTLVARGDKASRRKEEEKNVQKRENDKMNRRITMRPTILQRYVMILNNPRARQKRLRIVLRTKIWRIRKRSKYDENMTFSTNSAKFRPNNGKLTKMIKPLGKPLQFVILNWTLRDFFSRFWVVASVLCSNGEASVRSTACPRRNQQFTDVRTSSSVNFS